MLAAPNQGCLLTPLTPDVNTTWHTTPTHPSTHTTHH